MQKGIDPAVDRWIERFKKNFEPTPQNLIPLLQFAQDQEGYLPPETMEAVARFLRVPRAKVFGVASFYAQFHFEPRGRHTITVCRGTACHVRGSGPLLKDAETQLGIQAGGTTADLAVTLETVACYGSCAVAPVIVVDEVIQHKQTRQRLKALIEGLKATSPGPAKKPARKSTAVGSSSKGKRRASKG
jgi:NADH-quinone oxidoreductase subunit E